MLNKSLAACVLGILLMTPASQSNAAVSSNLAAGQMCAIKLYTAARGKSPAVLMRTAGKLVNFDRIIAAAALINGDTLTPEVRAKYKEGMADFAEHFVIPRLKKELQRAPHITAVSVSGNTLTISEGGSASLTVLRSSCQILNFKGDGVSLIGMVAGHIKANYT